MKLIKYLTPLALAILVLVVVKIEPVKAQSGPTFTFGAAGDFANGSNFQATVNQVAAHNPNFFIGLGDFSYSSGAEASWCGKWNATYRNVVLFTGNHDSGESGGGNINNYIQQCSYRPAGLNGNYGHQFYFDYPTTNPTTRFILIRPGIGGAGSVSYNVGGAGFVYTSNAIDDARAKGIPWVVVGMHKNYISAMEKPNELGSDLMPMLINKRVDLILQGHEHGYERSKQLTCATVNRYDANCVADSDNTLTKGAGSVIHVIGTGGQGLRGLNTGDSEYPYFASSDRTTYGFGKFTVTPTQLAYSFVRSAGGNFSDSFTITNSGAPVPTPTPVVSTPTPTVSATATPRPTVAPTVRPTATATPRGSILPSATPVATPGCPAVPTNLGVATLNININTSGVYNVWSRMMPSAGSSQANSYYFQVDNNCPVVVGDTNLSANTWSWVNYRDGDTNNIMNVNLTQGNHVIKLIGRERDLKLDKILVTDNYACIPTNLGDNCTNPTPKPTSTTNPQSTVKPPTITPKPASTPISPPDNDDEEEDDDDDEESDGGGNSQTFYPTADATLKQSSPSSNFGNQTTLEVDGDTLEIVYIRFFPNSLVGKNVKSAKIRLSVKEGSAATHLVKRINNTSWSESEITYNNRAKDDITTITQFVGKSTGSIIEVDVTNLVRERNGKAFTLELSSSHADGLDLSSEESSSGRPALVVEY